MHVVCWDGGGDDLGLVVERAHIVVNRFTTFRADYGHGLGDVNDVTELQAVFVNPFTSPLG
ncbi:hypothetical protein GCM10023334_117020 [Nonomuraea thailandensis]